MKSVSNIFIITILLSAHNLQASSNVVQRFLKNPSVSQFTIDEFDTLRKEIKEKNFALFCNCDGANALYQAAHNKDSRTLEIGLLLQGGADHGTDEKGLTALNKATIDRHITLQSLQNLIANNADISVKNLSELNALEYAIRKTNIQAVLLLAQAHAKNSLPISFAQEQYDTLQACADCADKETEYTKKCSIESTMRETFRIIETLKTMQE